MTARRVAVLAVMLAGLGGLAAAQDEELPLSNWSAPPYWSPVPRPDDKGDPGTMVAHAEGMQAQAEALPSAPLPFVAIAPCRIVDTREPIDDGFHRPNFGNDESRTFPFPSSAGCPGLPPTAGAWSVNIQFRPISQLSFLTAYPTGTTMPGVSTLTAGPAAWVQNAAVVPAGAAGSIDVYCQFAGRVIIDVNGFYGPQSVVTSLTSGVTTLAGDVTLAQGSNVTITPSGQTLTIAATGGPGGELPVGSTNQTMRRNGSAWVASSALTNDGTNVGIVGFLEVGGFVNAGKGMFSDATTNGTGLDGRANVGVNAWGVYGSSGEGIGVMGRSGSADGFAGRFENLSTGKAIGASVNGVEVMDVDAAGVHAGAGMTPTPLAHGVFDSGDGHRISGSSNIDCAWSAVYSFYQCTIVGEFFYYQSYTVHVTPSSLAVPVIGSMSGQLLIYFFNLSSAQVKPTSSFDVTVFKQ